MADNKKKSNTEKPKNSENGSKSLMNKCDFIGAGVGQFELPSVEEMKKADEEMLLDFEEILEY